MHIQQQRMLRFFSLSQHFTTSRRIFFENTVFFVHFVKNSIDYMLKVWWIFNIFAAFAKLCVFLVISWRKLHILDLIIIICSLLFREVVQRVVLKINSGKRMMLDMCEPPTLNLLLPKLLTILMLWTRKSDLFIILLICHLWFSRSVESLLVMYWSIR